MGSGSKQAKRKLRDLESRFKAWRSKRRHGSRIPEDLWERTVEVAQVYGIWKTSKLLKVDYYGLKKRCEAAKPASSVPKKRTPAKTDFVEVSWGEAHGPECVVELEDPQGARLRIGLRGAALSQLEAATRLLWRLAH